MTKVKIEQKNYYLINKDGSEAKFSDIKSLVLKVDDVVSETQIQDLFIKISNIDRNCIKGYSILYTILDEADFSVVNKETGENYQFGLIENPAIQWNDKEITEEQENQYLKIIESIIESKQQEQEPPKTEEIIPPTPLVEETPIPEEVPAVVEQEIVSEAYESEKKDFLEKGYKEFSSDNFRVLYNKKTEDIIFAEIVGEDFETHPVKSLDDNEFEALDRKFYLKGKKILFENA